MKITRKSMITNKEHTLDINVSEEQLELYESGAVTLQDAFPHLSANEREFIKSGITPQEWEEMFGGNDEC